MYRTPTTTRAEAIDAIAWHAYYFDRYDEHPPRHLLADLLDESNPHDRRAIIGSWLAHGLPSTRPFSRCVARRAIARQRQRDRD